MRGRSRSRRVIELVRDGLALETTSIERFSSSRIAVVAQYSTTSTMSRSVYTYLVELARCGYQVVVSSACEAEGPLRWPASLPVGVAVLRKPNLGYDFGSWAAALHQFPEIRKADRVLLTNDSMLGPFESVAPLLAQFHDGGADVWGITDSYQFVRHLQSYALGFRGGVLDSGALRGFFDDVRIERTKMDVVLRYEIGLSRLLASEGFSTQNLIGVRSLPDPDANPTLTHWRHLLERGVPFVKRTLVEQASPAETARIRSVIRSKYGANLDDWNYREAV